MCCACVADGEQEAMLACEQTSRYDVDKLYLAAADCDRSYVVCQSGSVVYSRLCPPGTLFHLHRLTCLDEQLCLAHQRDPRQIKFSLDDDDDAWNSRPGVRIKLKYIEPAGYDDGGGGAPEGLVRRQIKFRSVPQEFNSVDHDERRRQIKFRSLAARAVEAKKHKERRQLQFDALTNSADDDQPLISYGTDPLNALYYRRR